MKRLVLLLAAGLFFASTATAQDNSYKTAAGIRAGLMAGLTIKHFTNTRGALEGIVSSRWGGVNITGLYEIHDVAFDEPGLNWYYGFGGHVGFWGGDRNPWFDDNDTHTVVGVDMILGIEYTIPGSPVNLSLDWKPAVNLIGDSGFLVDDVALSLRFAFNR